MLNFKFFLVQLIGPHEHAIEAQENMQEAEALVATYGGKVVHKLVQHRLKPHPSTYIGPGKVEEIKQLVMAKEIGVVVINGLVKPSQLFRVEKLLWNDKIKVQVWDRLDLILGIFEKHAHSREAKLQIELARIVHSGPRIYGLGGENYPAREAEWGSGGEWEKRILRSRDGG